MNTATVTLHSKNGEQYYRFNWHYTSLEGAWDAFIDNLAPSAEDGDRARIALHDGNILEAKKEITMMSNEWVIK
jgi:hypothetical protein